MPKMSLLRNDAVRLFKEVGIVIADKWDDDKLQEKIRAFSKIQGVKEKVSGIEDEDLRIKGKKTLAACAQGVPIFVTGAAVATEEADAPEETDVETTEDVKAEPKAKKVAKPAKPVKPAAKPVKPAKPEAKKADKGDKPKKEKKEGGAKLDPWGTREGTRTARINAVLLKGKPVTTDEIQTQADAHGIHSHLSKLKAAKLIDRTADGKYVATKLGLSKKPAKK